MHIRWLKNIAIFGHNFRIIHITEYVELSNSVTSYYTSVWSLLDCWSNLVSKIYICRTKPYHGRGKVESSVALLSTGNVEYGSEANSGK